MNGLVRKLVIAVALVALMASVGAEEALQNLTYASTKESLATVTSWQRTGGNKLMLRSIDDKNSPPSLESVPVNEGGVSEDALEAKTLIYSTSAKTTAFQDEPELTWIPAPSGFLYLSPIFLRFSNEQPILIGEMVTADASDEHMFRWSPDKGVEDLGLNRTPKAVSADGGIVAGNDEEGAFRWTSTDGFQRLEYNFEDLRLFMIEGANVDAIVQELNNQQVHPDLAAEFSSRNLPFEFPQVEVLTSDSEWRIHTQTVSYLIRFAGGVLKVYRDLSPEILVTELISEDGRVIVGSVGIRSGSITLYHHPFLWTPESGTVDIAFRHFGVTWEVMHLTASCVANDHVLIFNKDNTHIYKAGLDGSIEDLGSVAFEVGGTVYNQDFQVSDQTADCSVIVGRIYSEDRTQSRAFRWSVTDGMKDLGPGAANYVASSGDVVHGTFSGPSNECWGISRFSRWTATGGIECLQDDGFFNQYLSYSISTVGISKDGDILIGSGQGGYPDYSRRIFRWSKPRGWEEIPVVSPNEFSVGPSTNPSPDGRWVAGTGSNLGTGQITAFLAYLGVPQRPAQKVNSTADRSDQNPGDGSCDTGQTITRPNGTQEAECTLRAAIEEANAKQGADYIAFDIPTNDPGYDAALGIWTIRPGTALPAITEQVTIDGYTQFGAQPNTEASTDTTKGKTNAMLRVVLNGQQLPKRALQQGTAGLVLLNHQGSTVQGLVINGFSGDGLRIEGGGQHQILGNFIGTNAAGQARVPNLENGIRIVESSGNYIGGPNAADRNLISGNGAMNRGGGVRIEEGAANNVVMHNLIGTDRTGTVALFNSAYGVALTGDGTIENVVQNNVISGNRDPQFSSTSCAGAGVDISNGAGGNGVLKNFIGTDETGTQALPNNDGVCVENAGAANWIQENLISGNVHNGVWISGQPVVNQNSRGTQVDRNNIGAARDTSLSAVLERIPALSNGEDGIKTGAPETEITGNLIATNGRHGIYGEGEYKGIRVIRNTVVSNQGWGVYLVIHREGVIQGNGIGELPPRRSSWREQGGILIRPDTTARARLVRLSNGEGAIRLEGSRKITVGGAAYDTEGNNLFVANADRNAVELIEKTVSMTGADSNRIENNVINGVGEGASGVFIVNSSDNTIRRNQIADFDWSGVAIMEEDGRKARRNRITETEFAGIGFFGFLAAPKAIDLEDDQRWKEDDEGDPDSGPNLLQNSPNAIAYIDWNGDLVLIYQVDSDPEFAAYPLTVEVFTDAFPLIIEPTAVFLQALTYPLASARKGVRVVLGKATQLGVRAGDLLGLTATDADGNTSEFSMVWVDSVDVQAGLDFGDAPETGNPQDPVPFGYPTKLAQDGARHGTVFNIRLGQALDAEADGRPDPFLEGDDAFPVPDDEDGLIFHTPTRYPSVVDPFREPVPQLYPGATELTVLNTVSGYVNLWIDFNRDGDWDDPDEYVLQDVFVPTGPKRPRQHFTVPGTIQPGLTALRVRFTTKDGAATTVTGAAPDGEVEDHLVALLPLPEQPYIDYGDAPDSAAASGYPTLLANQRYPAAGHVVGELRLGSLVDAEWDGQPDSLAAGDGSDEDGVQVAGPLLRGQLAALEVEVSGGEGYVNAWIDFNQDGDWADSTEHVVRDTLLRAGQHRLSFRVPDTAGVGRTYLRVRLSRRDSLSFWGVAPDGEVEDYVVEVAPATAVEAAPVPRRFALEAVYPNPAREAVTVRYALPRATRVRLVVYNVLGQVVHVLVDGRQGPGVYRAVLLVRDLPAGLYLVRLEADNFSENRQLVVLR